MPLELAVTIDQLVTSNPVDTDPLAEADDHLRLIKSALKATFPNLVGATTVTATSLSDLATVIARVTTLETNRARLDIANAFAASQHVAGNLNVTGKLYEGSNVLLPAGSIILWSGLVPSIPAGWALCNGSSGTPDLRGKFILGGGTVTPGAIGGASSATVATDTQGAVGAGVTGASGSHDHGAATGSHVLTTAETPAHAHTATVTDPGHYHAFANGFGPIVGGSSGGSGYGQTGGDTDPKVTGITVTNSSIGGGLGHTHTVASVADHTHTIPAVAGHTHAVTVATVPPYYALCFIMKL